MKNDDVINSLAKTKYSMRGARRGLARNHSFIHVCCYGKINIFVYKHCRAMIATWILEQQLLFIK